jgi:hypothetical protein
MNQIRTHCSDEPCRCPWILLTGFSVVLLTFAALWVVSMLTAMIIKAARFEQSCSNPSGPPNRVQSNRKLIAVITAAVAFATGGKSAIKDIRKLS